MGLIEIRCFGRPRVGIADGEREVDSTLWTDGGGMFMTHQTALSITQFYLDAGSGERLAATANGDFYSGLTV